ncbi:MAG: hypothetical protein AUI85_01300 [Acidobacteriales bacterium 13_1_40CM_3_55_5]|nr:MAG: hypothetical protein AUI85_01300 [Acidobacteriales bacterium 13_1_40CM_3_55_5]
MKAMILAAGLGTRLRPLTDDRPKALVELAGRTLLDITLSRLRSFGVREVIINVHHRAEMIVEYLKKNDNFGMGIEVSREEILLDTGGGLKKAAYFFLRDPAEQPFIVHNVDVISTIDLGRMVQFHTESHDQEHRLCGRRAARDSKPELVGSPEKVQELAFSGIHVISPPFLTMMIEEGVFSVIDCYLRLASQAEKIVGFRADEYYWRDLGKPANVKQAARDLEQKVLLQ